MNTVSAIIPTYNRVDFVAEAVESVLAQTAPVEEIIVVDDGSSDDTLERLGSFGDRIRVISQTNAGPSAARNHGLRLATGDFIAFLDSDDTWMPDKIERQLDCFEKFPKLDFVFGDIEVITAEGSLGREIPEGPERERFLGSSGPVAEIFEALVTMTFTVTSTVMLRRSAAQHVGFMDERFRLCEDLDYWLRAAACGCDFGFLPVVLTRRVKHEDNLVNDWRPRVDAQLAVLQKCLAEQYSLRSEMKDMLKARIGALHYDLGSHSLWRGDFQSASSHLSCAQGHSVPSFKRQVKSIVARSLAACSARRRSTATRADGCQQ